MVNALSSKAVTLLLQALYGDTIRAESRNKRKRIIRSYPGSLQVSIASGDTWEEAIYSARRIELFEGLTKP